MKFAYPKFTRAAVWPPLEDADFADVAGAYGVFLQKRPRHTHPIAKLIHDAVKTERLRGNPIAALMGDHGSVPAYAYGNQVRVGDNKGWQLVDFQPRWWR